MSRRRLFPTLGALLLSGSAATAQLRTQEVDATLGELRSEEPATVAAEIAAYGPEIALTLFETLDRGLPGENGRTPLSALERRVILEALGNIGRATIRPLLERELAGRQPTLSRRTALAILGEIGRASDLGRALELATPPKRRDPVARELASELQESCSRILDRDREGYRILRSLVRHARGELRTALIAGLASTGSHEALASLAAMLGLMPDLDAELLSRIAAVGTALARPTEASVRDEVRRYLWESDLRLRREAVFAAGALKDSEAIGRLIQLLKSTEASEGTAAHRALRRITGLSFAAEPTRWTTWLATEERWYRVAGPVVVGALQDGDPASAGRALNEVIQRRLFYGQMTPHVEGLLDSEDPGLRRKACNALARMGSWDQVPALVDALYDDEEPVARAAHAALLAITKRSFPPSSPRWLDVAANARRGA